MEGNQRKEELMNERKKERKENLKLKSKKEIP